MILLGSKRFEVGRNAVRLLPTESIYTLAIRALSYLSSAASVLSRAPTVLFTNVFDGIVPEDCIELTSFSHVEWCLMTMAGLTYVFLIVCVHPLLI